MKTAGKLLSQVILTLMICPSSALLADTGIIIDAVVATVEGEPITLHDLEKRLPGDTALTAEDLDENPAVKKLLDQAILENLLEVEAKTRQIGVSDAEVNAYLSEVARRNDMSEEEFSAALKAEGLSLERYASRIKMEILKSKFSSQVLQEGNAVTENEIDTFLKNHPELTTSDGKITLSQILLTHDRHSESEAKKILLSIKEKLTEGGSFPSLAARHSESPEAAEGGSLGVMALSDLSGHIHSAIKDLRSGDISEPIKSPLGWHLFRVDRRVGAEGANDEKLRSMVRAQLREQKSAARLDHLARELQDTYVVDRKY